MTAAAEQNAEEDQDPDPLIIVEKIAEASHIVILSLYRLDAVSLHLVRDTEQIKDFGILKVHCRRARENFARLAAPARSNFPNRLPKTSENRIFSGDGKMFRAPRQTPKLFHFHTSSPFHFLL